MLLISSCGKADNTQTYAPFSEENAGASKAASRCSIFSKDGVSAEYLLLYDEHGNPQHTIQLTNKNDSEMGCEMKNLLVNDEYHFELVDDSYLDANSSSL